MIVGFERLPARLQVGDEYENGTVVGIQPELRLITVNVTDPEGFTNDTRSEETVDFVRADERIPLISFDPNDPKFDVQYGPQQVGGPDAWSFLREGHRRDLCVVDTGLRSSHEEFDADRWLGGWDFANDDNDPRDDNGHGTHVTGIAAAGLDNGVGIAGIGNVQILHAKAVAGDGSAFISHLADAIRWCADNGGDVISMSIGTGSDFSSIERAVTYAWNQGSLLVAAAGNDGCGGCLDYPARYDEVIAVTCTGRNEALCSFSSFGANAELTAPGDSILSTYNEADDAYRELSGTSMSAPHVSGAAALLWGLEPRITNEDLRERLHASAKDLGPDGRDKKYGFGLLDIHQAALDFWILDRSEPLLQFDFETGAPPELSTSGFWHVDNLCAEPSSPPNYLGYHRETECSYEDLTQTEGEARFHVDLTDAHNATLAFDHFWETESNAGTVDVMSVGVSEDGGDSWERIARWDSEDPNPSEWRHQNLSLGSFLGQDVDVRFRFDAKDTINNDFTGWLVDDVEVWAITNVLPIARAFASPDPPRDLDGDGVETVTLNGSSSLDPDGQVTTYRWYLDGPQIGSGDVVHEDLSVGSHDIRLEIQDNEGATDAVDLTVEVLPNEPPVVTSLGDIRTSDSDGDGHEPIRIDGGGFEGTPLVFAQTQTKNGADAALSTQIHGISREGFTVEFCEQEKEDRCDNHDTEEVAWWAIDPVRWKPEPGFDYGLFHVDGSAWQQVTFDQPFERTPIVLGTVQSDMGRQEALYPEVRNVTTSGASIRYCEADGDQTCDQHTTETVGWIAIEPGTVQIDGRSLGEAGSHPTEDAQWGTVQLTETFETRPHVFATTQTNHEDEHPSAIHLRNVEPETFELQHCEWESPDSCGPHISEDHGWLALATSSHEHLGLRTGTINVTGDLHDHGTQFPVTLPGSHDPDGIIQDYTWSEDGTTISDRALLATNISVGVHNLTIKATDNGGATTEDVVEVTIEPNHVPNAVAGPDQTTSDGDGDGQERFALDASGSNDDDGEIVQFVWFKDGERVGTGPTIDLDVALGNHTIQLEATDNGGATGVDTVNVTVLPNRPPLPEIAPPPEVTDADGDGSGDVPLDGTGSSDPDGNVSFYTWSEVGTTLATGSTPTLNLTVGDHDIVLEVEDNAGATNTTNATVTVLPNEVPIADAGTDVTGSDSDGDGVEPVRLDASGSEDPDGVISTYAWSEAGELLAEGPAPEINFSVGEHQVVLNVTDNGGESDEDTVSVTVEPNIPPTADAGPNVTEADADGSGTETVALDGSDSVDEDGLVRSYTWTEDGKELTTGATPEISLSVGTHNITLLVEDNGAATDEDTVTAVIAENEPPEALAEVVEEGHDTDGDGEDTAQLDATDSTDPDGTVETYEWFHGGDLVGTGPTPGITLPVGTSDVTLTVTDNGGASATTTLSVTIHPNQPPTADVSAVCERRTCSFDATGSTDPDGHVDTYQWSFGDGESGTGAQTSHRYGGDGTFDVELIVTDNGGATATTTLPVTVEGMPTEPPSDPEIVDERTDAADAPGSPQSIDLDAAWFGNGVKNLSVGVHLSDADGLKLGDGELPRVYTVRFTPTWETSDSAWNRPQIPGSTFEGLRVRAIVDPTDGSAPETIPADLQSLSTTGDGLLHARTIGRLDVRVNETTGILWWGIPHWELSGSTAGGVIERTSASVRLASQEIADGPALLDRSGPGNAYILSDPTRTCEEPGRCGADTVHAGYPLDEWDANFETKVDDPFHTTRWNQQEGAVEITSYPPATRDEVIHRPLHGTVDRTDHLNLTASWTLESAGDAQTLVPLYLGPTTTDRAEGVPESLRVAVDTRLASQTPFYSVVYTDGVDGDHRFGSFSASAGTSLEIDVSYDPSARALWTNASTATGSPLLTARYDLTGDEDLRFQEIGAIAVAPDKNQGSPATGFLDDIILDHTS